MPPRVRIPRPLQPGIFYRRPAQTLDWCRKHYGSAFTLWIPPWGDVAIFTDSEHIRQIFRNDALGGGLDGGHAYKAVFNLLMGRHSMFSVEGDQHLRLRKLLMRALKGQSLDEHREPIERISIEEVDSWPTGERFQFEHAMQRLTLVTVIRDILGVSDRAHEDALRRLLPEIVNPGALIQLEVAFPAIRRLGPARRHHRIMAETKGVLREILADRRAASDLKTRTDVLSLLTHLPDDNGDLLTNDEAVDFIMTLILAGHETTAAQLTWVMDSLLRNPAILERLTRSLDAGEEEYLEAAIKEAMRLWPALPYVQRGVMRDVEIGKYRLPAGTTVGVGIAGMHHTPEYYPDPLAFRPERFLDGPAPAANTWIPWGGGRRRCAGQHFALVEMKVAISTVIHRVELRPWRAKPETAAGKAVTMVPIRGGEMVVTRRRVPVGAPAVRGQAPARAAA